LILSKNLGALGITLVLIPVVLFLGIRAQFLVAMVIAVFVLTYPLVRSAGVVPVERVMAIAHDIDPWRAISLGVRLQNEDTLLEKAQQRAAFGWGGYNRARVYDDQGRNTNILDGYWIITMGEGGWVRYLVEFGLLTGPIILLWWRRRRQYGIGMETSVLAVILAGNLLDLLPNSTITPLTWMIVGALWGRLELKPPDAVTASDTIVAGRLSAQQYSSAQKHGKNTDDLSDTKSSENGSSIYTRQRKKLYRRENLKK
jgi:hypothetical protein